MDLPTKLAPDLIREALFELRFEHSELPALLMAKLMSKYSEAGWRVESMPGGEIPDSIRSTAPALRYVPSYEIVAPEGGEVIRIGPNSISHHIVGAYIGWGAFQPKVTATIEALFQAVATAVPIRLGLRYINVATAAEHGISSIWELSLNLEVGKAKPAEDVFLTYRSIEATDLEALVKLLSPAFAEGQTPANATAIVDIDMFTPDSTAPADLGAIKSWLERAHDAEKGIFFKILAPDTLARLRES